MSSIVVSGDTSGAVTLSAPAVAGTVTVTLPSTSGTMASLASVTANGVAYVNSSGQPTSGSALVFDGTNLGIGAGYITATNTSNTTVAAGGFDATTSSSLRVVNASTTAGTGAGIYFVGGGNSESYIGNLYESSGVGALSFQTRVSGVRAERMRIDNLGNLLVGLTSGLGGLVNIPVTASLWGIGLKNTGASGNMIVFLNSSGTSVGSIFSDASSTSYVTSSDYRLKNTISPMTDALAKVALFKPVTYKWNIDGSDGQGFIAHELAEVCPQAVTGEKDAVNEDGSIKPQGIDTSFLVATLTSAIQEQQALITTLTARITALEGA
jgi:hypothetical protein